MHALDFETGAAKWQFMVGGRIDSSPSLFIQAPRLFRQHRWLPLLLGPANRIIDLEVLSGTSQ
ncbi:MAG: hypothetical protein GWQ05_05210 [Verrucomicrobiaceae bacterium]|nr:hypothetical protein [Verrucomicrobiaceae bacterium]NCF90344.1 hypothetical protein [Verrucomicrobiaceae bacterium]